MRSPLLVLLPVLIAMVLAPTAPVRTVEPKVEPNKEAASNDAPAEQPEKQPSERTEKNEKKEKDKRTPVRTYWCELTPALQSGDGPMHDDREPELCPELAPALSARRLPVVPRFPEPPTEPDKVSLRSGYLALPPPVA